MMPPRRSGVLMQSSVNTSGQVEATGAAVVVEFEQIAQEALRDLLGVGLAVCEAVQGPDGEHRKALGTVEFPDRGFQRVRPFVVSVTRDQDHIPFLTGLPHPAV